MSGAAIPSAILTRSIVVDEIGLESAVLGDFRLRTMYRPLFARNGDDLHPVAVEGSAALWRDGRAVDMEGVLSGQPDFSRNAKRLGRILAIRNMANIGAEAPLGLLLRWETGAEVDDETELLLAEAEGSLVDPSLMIVLAHARAADAQYGLRLWRDRGASVAVSNLADMEPALEVDLVRMAAPWLAQQLADPGASRLLRVAVERLREAGVGLLVDDVASPVDLDAAVAVAADLMQGSHLAHPFRVGAVFDDAPRPIGTTARAARLFG